VWEWIQAQDDRNWKNIQGLQELLGISTFADLIDTPKAIFEETIRSVAGFATNAISNRIMTAYPQAFAKGTLPPFCHRVPHTSTCHPCSSSPAPFELVVC
jgi:hypothetical protein